jgi:hypothetical protein
LDASVAVFRAVPSAAAAIEEVTPVLSRTTIVFARPFDLPGFDERLPAGDYDIETELSPLHDHRDPGRWKASVMLELHPRSSHPGLARNLTVSLADLDGALARDKLTGKNLATFLLDEMLADPMVRLVMQADGVSEAQLRHLYAGSGNASEDPDAAPASDDPVSLDTRRSAESLIAADIRRHSLKDFEADQSELRKRQEELEAQLLAEPARTWHEAAARAQYLIRRYAETAEAQDARKQKLVARALGDLARLMEDDQ